MFKLMENKINKVLCPNNLKDLLISTYDGDVGVRDVALSITCETKFAAFHL